MQSLSKILLTLGLLVAALLCFYVPFKAVADFNGKRPSAYAGYGWIWAPPDRETVCSSSFDISNPRMCHVTVDREKALFGILGAAFLFGALFVVSTSRGSKT